MAVGSDRDIGQRSSKVAEPGGRFGCVRYLRHSPETLRIRAEPMISPNLTLYTPVLGIFAICFDLKLFSLLC